MKYKDAREFSRKWNLHVDVKNGRYNIYDIKFAVISPDVVLNSKRFFS